MALNSLLCCAVKQLLTHSLIICTLPFAFIVGLQHQTSAWMVQLETSVSWSYPLIFLSILFVKPVIIIIDDSSIKVELYEEVTDQIIDAETSERNIDNTQNRLLSQDSTGGCSSLYTVRNFLSIQRSYFVYGFTTSYPISYSLGEGNLQIGECRK